MQGSHMRSPAFQLLFYAALRTLIDELGVRTFNAAIYNIPLLQGQAASGSGEAATEPVIARWAGVLCMPTAGGGGARLRSHQLKQEQGSQLRLMKVAWCGRMQWRMQQHLSESPEALNPLGGHASPCLQREACWNRPRLLCWAQGGVTRQTQQPGQRLWGAGGVWRRVHRPHRHLRSGCGA